MAGEAGDQEGGQACGAELILTNIVPDDMLGEADGQPASTVQDEHVAAPVSWTG
jgi:hypothetical protein